MDEKMLKALNQAEMVPGDQENLTPLRMKNYSQNCSGTSTITSFT
jgi:hypothetical protein